jgi:hypothetical protein
MGKRGCRSGAKSAGCACSACSALNEWPHRVGRSAGDGPLSPGLDLGSGFGLGAGAGVGTGVAEEFGSGAGASRVAAVVESARVEHVGRHERGGVELVSASAAETARTQAMVSRQGIRLFRLSRSLARPLAGLAAAHPPTPSTNGLHDALCLLFLSICLHALLDPGMPCSGSS